MSTIVVGDCATENIFEIWDADAARESEFEFIVAKALICIYPNYHCFPFAGSFKLEDNVSRPDIAMVAKDMSHWFVIEVEIISHSLDAHVLPQIRAFRYGEPQSDCVGILSRELRMDPGQVETFLLSVPRTVAVIANKRHRDWEISFRSLEVQLLTVSAFSSPAGVQAVEVDGRLIAQQEHIGFGYYAATDRSLRFHRGVNLPDGAIMIDEFSGAGSMWTVTRDASYAWVTRNKGTPDILNGSLIQMVRAYGGRFSIKQPPGY